MHKKFIVLLLVLALASTASARYILEDFEGGEVGICNGQNGGVGWSSPWSGSSSFDIVQETGNKYLNNAYAGTKSIGRGLSYSEDVYSVQMDFRLGSRQDTWDTGTPCQFQVLEGDGDDPVHIKFEPSFERIRVGNVWLTDYGNIADGILTDLKNPYVEWVTIRVDADEVAGTIELFWEATDGSMISQGMGAIESGQAGDDQEDVELSTRTGGVGKEFQLDNILITPEPATIMMFGLGGLALIRKKR
jgi:hypothetical protein